MTQGSRASTVVRAGTGNKVQELLSDTFGYHRVCGPYGGSTKDRGINFLTLNDLFWISCARKNIMNYEVQIQMVKIYNEQVRDLLLQDSSVDKIRNCASNGGLSLPDATMHLVKSTNDVLNLMKLALAQKNSHIPYGNRKLTQLLQDSLGGHAKTLMFVHVSPEADSYAETESTLKFVERTSAVELGAARLNKESAEVRELRKQVESLKNALTSKEAETAETNKVKEVKPPPEKTPPCSLRLSIEGSVTVKSEVTAVYNALLTAVLQLKTSKLQFYRTP
ncbi:hypothetical protein GIB67_015254 [Kingdonia uniflora]|uniref:Kinesin motor domain-containing protein n=1 Tax=Kingdonia uniflora TaxID=39325 RepID=A0A7J7MTB6_9MAGN|nr:hypothetical protein GIB67_015254 [Kingdonia uniflora]